jgi:nucleoside-diphosphate-sugar epimerase
VTRINTTKSEKLVLLTGATGFIGARVKTLLIDRGYRLRVLTRRLVKEHATMNYIFGDLADISVCNRALEGVNAVIHIAGEKKNPSSFWLSNVKGVENLLDASVDAGIESFVHLSSVGVIGADPLNATIYDEEAFCNPRNDYECSKLEAEKLVCNASSQGLPVTILRPSIVIGDGDPGHVLLRTIRKIAQGRFVYWAGKNVICNYVYVDDVAQACLALMKNPKANGHTYHISDDCLFHELIEAIAQELSVKKPALFLPDFVFAVERKALRYLRQQQLLSRFPIINGLTFLNNQAQFHTPRLFNDLGFQCPVGWREGLRRLIRWYRSEGLL